MTPQDVISGIGWAEGYTLDLYCGNIPTDTIVKYQARKIKPGEHYHQEFPHSYTGELGSTCRREARESGWKFSDKSGRRVAVCPRCAKNGVTIKQLLEKTNDRSDE